MIMEHRSDRQECAAQKSSPSLRIVHSNRDCFFHQANKAMCERTMVAKRRGRAGIYHEIQHSNDPRPRQRFKHLGLAGWKSLLLWALTFQCCVHGSGSGTHVWCEQAPREVPSHTANGPSRIVSGSLTGGVASVLRIQKARHAQCLGLCLRGGGEIEDNRAARKAERLAKKKKPPKAQGITAEPWRYQKDDEVRFFFPSETNPHTKKPSCLSSMHL
jgi:hypothetical protein